MDRSDWDQRKINAVALEARARGTEQDAVSTLRSALEDYFLGKRTRNIAAMRGLQVVWRNAGGERRSRSDADLIFDGKIVGRLELESGMYQSNWTGPFDEVMRRRWPWGPTLLYRKFELDDDWDIFVKTNMNYNSFFAMTKPWIKQKFKFGEAHFDDHGKLDVRGERVKTCEDRIAIPWELVDKATKERDQGFAIDDWNKLCFMLAKLASEKMS